MLKVSFHRWAGGGVLAHTHGSVALIHLTHFALLAVVVQTGICGENRSETAGFTFKGQNVVFI